MVYIICFSARLRTGFRLPQLLLRKYVSHSMILVVCGSDLATSRASICELSLYLDMHNLPFEIVSHTDPLQGSHHASPSFCSPLIFISGEDAKKIQRGISYLDFLFTLNIRLENQTRIFFSGFSLLGAKLSALTSLPRYSKISH